MDARSEDILNAVEAAVEDGMDVLNLSLGGGYHGNNDLLAKGLDNAVERGRGRGGRSRQQRTRAGHARVPGRARKIITVGASTNQHFVGQPFTYPAGGGTTIGAAVGDFDPLPAGTFDLFDTHSDGCASVDPGAAGKMAIIDRGACTFSQKVANAKAAGAIACYHHQQRRWGSHCNGQDGGLRRRHPAVMIAKNDGAALRASGATTASADATFQEFITEERGYLRWLQQPGPDNRRLCCQA